MGRRIAEAREAAKQTMDSAVSALEANGTWISKGGVGHWETGTNNIDALWLHHLAKLYETTPDALLGWPALSKAALGMARQLEAAGLADQFDAMKPAEQKRCLSLLRMLMSTTEEVGN